MDIGHKLQAIRTEHEMTQAEFAAAFNVSRQTVSNWENNKNYPDLDTLCKISEAYNISLDVFLKEDREYVSHIDKITIQATQSKKWLKILTPILIILLIVSVAFAIKPDSVNPDKSVMFPGVDDINYEYPVNENGQTYGIDWMGDDYDKHAPDLIKAEGVNGKTGYVKRADLDDDESADVKNPKDAIAYMNRVNQRKGKNYYRVIPVFKKDGITEIDQFWIYNGAYNGAENNSLGIDGDINIGKKIAVPDLIGLSRDEAKNILSEVGLVLGNVISKSNDISGKVVSQSPTAGSSVNTGSCIDISIDN